MPVSGYLGWATIATVAGTGTTAQWAGFEENERVGAVRAAVALLLLVAWIGSRVLTAAGFAALLGWGLVAVAVGTSGSAVAVAAGFAALVALATVVVRVIRSERPSAVLFG